jgi:lantibiotic transport system ATP-binding protein
LFMSYAVESVGLGRRFGSSWALRDVELAVPAGAVFGFLGPNGAGKTTTIRLMLGLLRPSAGSVRIYGHDAVRERLIASGMVGALLDARVTYEQLSGRENLDITRRLLNLPTQEIDRVLDFVSLVKEAGRKVAHYSLGMRQRLGLARALLGAPKLLVLDEPMNGLDPDGIRDMRAIIRELPARTGATVFLSSHLLSEVEQTATHIGLMHQGKLVLQGAIDDVLAHLPVHLAIRAIDMSRARACLNERGYTVVLHEQRLLVPLTGGDNEAVEINHQLQRAGADVIEIVHQTGSLEALYMKLAQHEAPSLRRAA